MNARQMRQLGPVTSQINNRTIVSFPEVIKGLRAKQREARQWRRAHPGELHVVRASDIQPQVPTNKEPAINVFCPVAEFTFIDPFGHFDFAGMKFCYRCSGRCDLPIQRGQLVFERCAAGAIVRQRICYYPRSGFFKRRRYEQLENGLWIVEEA